MIVIRPFCDSCNMCMCVGDFISKFVGLVGMAGNEPWSLWVAAICVYGRIWIYYSSLLTGSQTADRVRSQRFSIHVCLLLMHENTVLLESFKKSLVFILMRNKQIYRMHIMLGHFPNTRIKIWQTFRMPKQQSPNELKCDWCAPSIRLLKLCIPIQFRLNLVIWQITQPHNDSCKMKMLLDGIPALLFRSTSQRWKSRYQVSGNSNVLRCIWIQVSANRSIAKMRMPTLGRSNGIKQWQLWSIRLLRACFVNRLTLDSHMIGTIALSPFRKASADGPTWCMYHSLFILQFSIWRNDFSNSNFSNNHAWLDKNSLSTITSHDFFSFLFQLATHIRTSSCLLATDSPMMLQPTKTQKNPDWNNCNWN